jgi:hypothetical protein
MEESMEKTASDKSLDEIFRVIEEAIVSNSQGLDGEPRIPNQKISRKNKRRKK